MVLGCRNSGQILLTTRQGTAGRGSRTRVQQIQKSPAVSGLSAEQQSSFLAECPQVQSVLSWWCQYFYPVVPLKCESLQREAVKVHKAQSLPALAPNSLQGGMQFLVWGHAQPYSGAGVGSSLSSSSGKPISLVMGYQNVNFRPQLPLCVTI